MPISTKLNWKEFDGQLDAAAFGIDAFYVVRGSVGSWSIWSPGPFSYAETPGYKAKSAAQAAAQLDYERRVLASIDAEHAERLRRISTCAAACSTSMKFERELVNRKLALQRERSVKRALQVAESIDTLIRAPVGQDADLLRDRVAEDLLIFITGKGFDDEE